MFTVLRPESTLSAPPEQSESVLKSINQRINEHELERACVLTSWFQLVQSVLFHDGDKMLGIFKSDARLRRAQASRTVSEWEMHFGRLTPRLFLALVGRILLHGIELNGTAALLEAFGARHLNEEQGLSRHMNQADSALTCMVTNVVYSNSNPASLY